MANKTRQELIMELRHERRNRKMWFQQYIQLRGYVDRLLEILERGKFEIPKPPGENNG